MPRFVLHLEAKALDTQIKIGLAEPALAPHTMTSKLHLRRMVHLFADSLLSVASSGSSLDITADSKENQATIRMSLPATASPGHKELASSFGVALALAYRLGIATGLRLDPARGHELTLSLPAPGPS